MSSVWHNLHFGWLVQLVYEHWDQGDRLQQRADIQSWDPWDSDGRFKGMVWQAKKRGVTSKKTIIVTAFGA